MGFGELLSGNVLDTLSMPVGSVFSYEGDPFDSSYSVLSNTLLEDVVFYIHDHLGNTRVTYQAEKNGGTVDYTLKGAFDYYPYGKTLRTFNPQEEKYLSTHHERDQETGFDYRGARFYDSDVARFLSLDPLAIDYPGLSDYVYVADNPLIYIDPSGEFMAIAIGTVVGGIAGGVNAYINNESLAGGFAEGATSGFIAGAVVDITVATGGTGGVLIAAAAAGGALGGGVGDITGQLAESLYDNDNTMEEAVNNVSFDNTLDKVKKGAINGAIGGTAGAGVGKTLQVLSKSNSVITGVMSQNITTTSKTLTNMGANSTVTATAVEKITTGMGTLANTSTNNIIKAAAITTFVSKTGTSVSSIKKNETHEDRKRAGHGR